MAAWNSICWVNNLWAAVSAARIQRRPQAARHQTPVARAASCRLARALGRVRGRGVSGPPSGGRDQPPRGLRDGDGDRPRPPPRRRAAGGVPAGGGRIRRRRRHGRRQGRQPHAKAAAASDRATAPTAERPGGGAAAPRTQAASNETGRRPTTGRAPRRQPPAHTNGGEGARAGAGQGRAAAMGRGRPGRASTGPACTRPAAYLFLSQPATFGGGRGQPPRGRPRPQGAFAPETAGGPRGPGAAAYGQGLTERGAADPVPGGGDGTDRSRGRPSRSWGGVGGKKNGRGACPSGWTRLDEKKCGEDALSPPLAVTADTRYPPVRRSSPKRTRCRPVPYALAVRRSPGPPSCLP